MLMSCAPSGVDVVDDLLLSVSLRDADECCRG